MKLFRRISALALALVLVSVFSASAFAASTHWDLEKFNDEHILVSRAEIEQIGTNATLSIDYAPGFESSELRINCIYDYKDHSNTPHSVMDYEIAYDTYTCYFEATTSQDPLNIKQFTQAVYSFDATFTASGIEFTYDSPSVTITP